MRFQSIGCLWLLVGALAACAPEPAVKLGFLGGLTNRNADNGQAGLGAVQLAVDAFNRAGGLDGRPLELLVRDDAQDPAVAEQATRELVAAGVVAVIGPFTSSMAQASVPVTGQAGVFQISPTITSMDFHGIDDHLFRINRTTRDNARDYAQVIARRGLKRVAVAYDIRNRSFTESWLREFREAMEALGRPLVLALPYESHAELDFAEVVQPMLQARPDMVFFIAGALDVARLAQQAQMLAPGTAMGASEWAATEVLVELGGKVLEGLLIVQNFDRDDTSPAFVAFKDAYFSRFQRQPGYSAVAAHDAATVVLAALQAQRPGETLKQAAQRLGRYQGLQQTIVFDRHGDTERRVYFTEIRGGRYLKLSPP